MEVPPWAVAKLIVCRKNLDGSIPLGQFRLTGAERYSAEAFHRALQFLGQAENLFAHKRGKDNPELKEKAREAIEAAEQARLVAAEQLRVADPLRPASEP